jgi:hypothetical protein
MLDLRIIGQLRHSRDIGLPNRTNESHEFLLIQPSVGSNS